MANLLNLATISKALSHPTWDMLAIFFFIAIGFFYGISTGKTKLIAVLLSLYASALVFKNISYIDAYIKGRNLLETFLFRGVIFAVIVFLLAILFNRLLSRDYSAGAKSWLSVFLLSFLEVGLLASLVFQLLPAKELFTFSPIVQNLFASDKTLIWWLTLPLIVLFFISRKR